MSGHCLIETFYIYGVDKYYFKKISVALYYDEGGVLLIIMSETLFKEVSKTLFNKNILCVRGKINII